MDPNKLKIPPHILTYIPIPTINAFYRALAAANILHNHLESLEAQKQARFAALFPTTTTCITTLMSPTDTSPLPEPSIKLIPDRDSYETWRARFKDQGATLAAGVYTDACVSMSALEEQVENSVSLTMWEKEQWHSYVTHEMQLLMGVFRRRVDVVSVVGEYEDVMHEVWLKMVERVDGFVTFNIPSCAFTVDGYW